MKNKIINSSHLNPVQLISLKRKSIMIITSIPKTKITILNAKIYQRQQKNKKFQQARTLPKKKMRIMIPKFLKDRTLNKKLLTSFWKKTCKNRNLLTQKERNLKWILLRSNKMERLRLSKTRNRMIQTMWSLTLICDFSILSKKCYFLHIKSIKWFWLNLL